MTQLTNVSNKLENFYKMQFLIIFKIWITAAQTRPLSATVGHYPIELNVITDQCLTIAFRPPYIPMPLKP